MPPPPLPKIGETVSKYRIDRVIGQGGMGVVFEATHMKLEQRVAIKMLMPALLASPELVGRFEREARAAANLRHHNAARVSDVDQTESGIPYMVMELLHGHDLDAELTARGPLPIGEAIGYVVQAGAAMVEAHAAGTVHRDLKPSNLFLNEEADGTRCVKVLDFGISKIVSPNEARVTATETQMGTPLYMSPEQVRSAKNVDHRSDIWSLGVIAYELLAGKPPFIGSAAGVGAQIVADEPPPLRDARPDVPEDLAAAIARAMSKDPAARFQSMREMLTAFAPFSSVAVPPPALARPERAVSTGPSIGEAPTLVAPVTGGGTNGNWSTTDGTRPPRRTLVMGGAMAALVAVGAAGAIFASTRHQNPPTAAAPPETSIISAAPSPSPSPLPSASPAPSPTREATPAPPPSASVKPAARPLATSTRSAAPTPKPTQNNPDRL
ncbi:MAG TPA: protein kinase [Polyangiaceae bacterium]